MRSYKYNKNEFFGKMKKKPKLEEIISNLDTITIEQIEALKGPQFPKWIREELVKYKNRDGRTAKEVAEYIALLMVQKSIKK